MGPIFDEGRATLPSGIPVLNAFFCIVVDEVDGDSRALAFITEHVDEDVDELAPFLTTADEVERRSGVGFFHRLPGATESALERMGREELWELPLDPN